MSPSKIACDNIPNRFELVLVDAHRARALGEGSAIKVERDNDRNAVVALSEIAEKTISPDDMRERLIHSIQEHVEIDEPETVAAPALPRGSRNTLGRDDPAIATVVETMTEEMLLRGLESLTAGGPFEDARTQGAM